MHTSAATWFAPKRSNGRSEVNIDSLATKFFANRDTAAIEKVLVPCGSNGDTCGERSVVVRVSDTERSVLQAELRDAHSQCTTGVSDTSAHEDSAPGCDVGLFGKGHV
jgi:hypothetical protein